MLSVVSRIHDSSGRLTTAKFVFSWLLTSSFFNNRYFHHVCDLNHRAWTFLVVMFKHNIKRTVYLPASDNQILSPTVIIHS